MDCANISLGISVDLNFCFKTLFKFAGNTASSCCADRISTKKPVRDQTAKHLVKALIISLKITYFQIFRFSYFISNKCWGGLFYLRAIGQARNPNHKALVGQNIKLQIYDSPCQMLLCSIKYRGLKITENNIIYYQLIVAY